MSTLTAKEQEDAAKIAVGCTRLAIGWPVRIAMVTYCLNLVIPFWLTYLHMPQEWLWWYGLILGMLPLGVVSRWFARLVIVATIATFIASFFV